MINWQKKLGISKLKKKNSRAIEKNKYKNLAAWRVALSLGLGLSPWLAVPAEAALVRADKGTTVTNAAGNVHEVYAGQVNGSIATNRFTRFDLPEKNIANLYFKESLDSAYEANKLFNFVQERIDVKGTINAIKGNTIGGDVYFLSPKGMVVGSTGVLNVGSLTVMAGGKHPTNDTQAVTLAQQVEKAEYKLDENKSSNITIAGRINAYGNIILESNKEVLVLNGAKLQTQRNMDFTNLVNVGGVDSGLDASGENLVVARDEDSNGGNIVLRAAIRDKNEHSTINGWLTTLTDNTAKATVEIEKNTSLEADGTVSIGAHATLQPSMGNLVTFGNITQTIATVKVNGTINASNIAITADAENVYQLAFMEKGLTTVRAFASDFGQKLLNTGDIDSFVDLDVNVVAMKSDSNVEFGNNAKLTAIGADASNGNGAIQVNSNSNIKIEDNVGANSSSVVGDKKLASGLFFSYVENEAKIKVKDDASLVTAAKGEEKGSVNLAAKADTNLALTSAIKTSNSTLKYGADAAVALVSLKGETLADIDFGKAELVSAKDASITAKVANTANIKAWVQSSQNTNGSTSIIYDGLDTKANVNVDGTVKATENLNITAENEDGIEVNAANEVTPNGLSTYVGGFIEPATGDFVGLANTFINSLNKNVPAGKLVPGAFSFGTAISYVDVKNTASVNINNTALLEADEISVNADQSYERLYVKAMGVSSKLENEKAINAGIAIVTTQDDAIVNVAGAVGDASPRLQAKDGDLNLGASSKFEWDRTGNLKKDLLAALAELSYEEVRKAKEAGLKVPKDIEDYVADPTDAKAEELYKSISKNPSLMSWISGSVTAFFGLAKLYGVSLRFADATYYVNVNGGSTVRASHEGANEFAFAGAGVITDYTRKASVVVGSDAELTAGGNLNINAIAKQIDADLAGLSQGFVGTFGENLGIPAGLGKILEQTKLDIKLLPGWSVGEGTVVGGNIGHYTNNVQSGVVIAEGVKLTSDAVKLNANTEVQRYMVSAGGGAAGTTGITGMFTINKDMTSSIVAVDDEATLTARGVKSKDGIEIKADNDSLLISIDGDVTLGAKNAIGVGVGYDKNTVYTFSGVRDNDKETLAQAVASESLDKDTKAYYEVLDELLSDDAKKNLGTTGLMAEHSLDTPKLVVEATSTPIIWNVAGAGAASKAHEEPQPQPQPGNVNNAQAAVADDDDWDDALNMLFADPNANNNAVVGAANGGQQALDREKIIASGAVDINMLKGLTAAMLEDTVVNLTSGNRAVDIKAHEDGMAVGISGALSFKTSGASNASFEGMLSGTSAVNVVAMDVLSQTKGLKINNALAVTNKATKAEKVVATAVPVAIDASAGNDQTKGFAAAVNASVNAVDNNVNAIIDTTEIYVNNGDNATRVQNFAYDQSTQITGGIEVEVAKTNVGIGANVVWARLNNKVKAAIQGKEADQEEAAKLSDLQDIGLLENIAASNLTQINLAVGMGVGDSEHAQLMAGALWTNAIVNNDTIATINKANIEAQQVNNKAIDGSYGDETLDDTWSEEVTEQGTVKFTKTDLLKSVGVDADGSQLKQKLKENTTITQVDTEELKSKTEKALSYKTDDKLEKEAAATSNYKNTALNFNTDKKTLVINGGLLVEAANGKSKAVGGLGIADSLVDNDYRAEIIDSTITAKGAIAEGKPNLNNIAKNESEIYTVAMGASWAANVDNVVNGAGSVAANKLRNDTISLIENSDLTANSINTEAETTSKLVAVAGAVIAGSAKGGVGLAIAVNDMGNNIKSQVLGSYLQGMEKGALELNVKAKNEADIDAVGIGLGAISAESTFAGQGNIAVNVGYNNTEAAVDRSVEVVKEKEPKTGKEIEVEKLKRYSALDNINSLKINAADTSHQAAAATGLLFVGGKAGGGIGFAVNKISDQTLAARLNNAIVTTVAAANIEAKTKEEATLDTVAIGLGINGGNNKFAFEGAGAITLAKNKKNVAEAVNTHLGRAEAGTAGAEVYIEAKEINTIVSNADSISAGLGQEQGAVGLGASVINLESNTTSTISDSEIFAENIRLNAEGHQNIYNIGVGAGGGKSALAGAGSLTLNYLTNNVAAQVKDSKLTANNNVAVTAKGEDSLGNFSGGTDITVGGTVGIGLAVVYNDLQGDVTATVEASEVKALGKGSTAKANKAHSYTTDNTNKMSINSAENHQGLLVDAYGSHDITDVALTLGVVAGTGYSGAGIGVDGLGSHTIQGGKTGAYLKNTDVNKGETKVAGDVVVTAVDDTTLHDVDVNLSVAAGEMGAISGGITVAMADLERTIEAKVDGNKEAATDDEKRNTVNGNELQIQAGGKSDTNLVTVGVGIGGSSVDAGAVGALADAITDKKTIKASLTNVNSTNNGLTLTAANDAILNYKGVGVLVGGADGFGGALGVAVGSMQETNTIGAVVENATITHDKATAEDLLAVTNSSKAIPNLVAINVGGGEAGAAIGFAVDSHTHSDKLSLDIINAQIGSKELSAASADFKVNNYIDIDRASVNVAVAAALYGGAIGINVQPTTINSAEVMNIADSAVYAKKIGLETAEYRKLNLDAINVAAATLAGIGVTRSYTTFGGQLMTTYSTQNNGSMDDKFKDDLGETISKANEALAQGQKKLTEGVKGTLDQLNKGAEEVVLEGDKSDVGKEVAKKDHNITTGKVQEEGLKLNSSLSNYVAETMAVKSTVTDAIDLYSGTGSVGVASVNVNATRVDQHLKNTINIEGGKITADDLSVLGTVTGDTYVHATAAIVGGAAANVAYADIYTDGNLGDKSGNSITLDGVEVETNNSLLVRALDDAKYRTYTSGGGIIAVGGGYIEAESKEELDNTVTLKNSSLTNKAILTSDAVVANSADKTVAKAVAGAMEIVSLKSSYAEAKTMYGGVNGVGGLTNSTTASIKGNSDIILKDNIAVKDASVVMKGDKLVNNQAGVLDLYALYNAHTLVDMTYGSGDLLAAGGGVYGHANSEGRATITAENNSFDLQKLKAHSEVKDNHNGNQDKYNLAETHTKAINIVAVFGVDVNKADATINTISNTSFKNNSFAYNTINKPVDILSYQEVEKAGVKTYEPVYKYEQIKEGKAQVDLKADTSTKAVADIYGVTAGIGVAVGHNAATVNVTESTLATMDNSGLVKEGKPESTYLKALNLNTNGTNVVDNLAEGSGGAVFAISPYAFSATNNLEITNKAALKGDFDIAEDLTVTASQRDDLEIKGTSKGAGIVDAAGGDVANNRTFSTETGKEEVNKTTVAIDGANITASSAHISASNDLNLNKRNGYGVEGGAVSILLAASSNNFTNKLDEAAQVKITGSSITTKENLDVNASTLNEVFVKSSFSNGGALFGYDGVNTDSKFNYTNDISVDAASKLKTTSSQGDIVMSSVDDTTLQVGSYAYAYGLVESIASPTTDNTTKRENSINVAGELFSSNDLKLYAGQYAKLSHAGLEAVVDVESYASSLIPGITPSEIHNTITENNIVKLDKGSKASSVGNMDIYANEGDVSIVVNDRSSHGYWSKEQTQEYYTYVATKNHTAKDALHSNDFLQTNQVIIDGTATAGTVNKVDMIIGKVGEFIVLNKADREAYNASNPNKQAVAKPTISYGDNSIKFSDKELSYKTVNLSLSLLQEYNEAQQIAAQYSAETTSEAYMVARARIAAIEDQMIKLGMVQLDEKGAIFRDGDGRVVPTETVRTDAIVLPDITVSGGNISINTQDLVSSQGSMKAYGSPEVNIINESNLYLLLGDVFVGEAGGEIFYTNNSGHKTSIDAAAPNLAAKNELINDLNAKVKNTSFAAIDNDGGTGSGEINIQGAYNGPQTYTVNPHLTDSESADQKYTYKVMADIELGKGKEIVNSQGKVIVNSANNNLYINGNVVGRDIVMTAAHGSLYQNSISSAIDIGGDVKQLYDALAKDYINPTSPGNPKGTSWSGSGNHYTFNLDSQETAVADNKSGRIMGENIYITAESINVNGLIQSGYEKYTYTATDADISVMATLDEKYRNETYTDDNIIAMGKDSAFCIKQGGMIWNETKGYYDYDVPVYYNPSTHKILIPNIVSHAGNIYLTGKVASTGSGRLVAMDGTYNINLDTSLSNNDLKLYGLETTDNVGKITIVDTQRHTSSVITRNGYEVTPLTGEWDTPSAEGVVTNSSRYGYDYTYNPLENQRYSWTMGMDTATRTYYERKFEANWWGVRNSKDVTNDTGSATRLGNIDLDNKSKDSANNIGILEGTNYGNFHITADKVHVEGAASDPTITRWETGLWGFRKHELYKWHVDSGDSYQYNISVNASQPIDIKFIGNEERNSDVKVTAGGSIDIHGNVGNKDFLSQENIKSYVEINSNNGGIFQDKGTLVGHQVVLRAAGSMEGIAIEGKDHVTLVAENTATADTEYYRGGVGSLSSGGVDLKLNVQVQDGGAVNLYGSSGNLAGDTTLVESFSLTTNGNINQLQALGDETPVITASRVDLVSTDGAIGAEAVPVKVNTGDTPLISTDSMSASLNAQAKGYIYLAETTGDMRVGHISSELGDVVLQGPGSLIDALPYAENTRGRSDEALMEHWSSLGLFEDREYLDADGNMQKAMKFDAQRLLYAIADEKINPQGIPTSDKTANIKAKNLLLKMGDSAGLNSEKTIEYKISELGTKEDITDLRTLAKADASSVEWNDQEDKVTIREKLPIGVELTGTLRVEGYDKLAAEGNVYVEARRENLDATNEVNLKVESIVTQGDVLLKNSLSSIYNAAEEGKVAIIAHDLELGAGQTGSTNGFLGTKDNYLPISISGTLKAVGTGGVYVKQLSELHPLTLANVFSNGDIYLESVNDIISTIDGNTRSYINWGEGKTLSLISHYGNVGTEANYIRVINEEDLAEGENPEDKRKLSIKAEKSVYLEGMSLDIEAKEPQPLGTLFVQGISAKESLNIRDNGNIYVVEAEAPMIKLEAKAQVLEAANAKLTAEHLLVQATKGIVLNSDNNNLHFLEFYNSGKGDVTITNGVAADKDLVIIGAGKNWEETAEGVIQGQVSVTAKSKDLINQNDFMAAGDIELITDKGDIINDGTIDSTTGSIVINASDNVENRQAITALGSLDIDSGYSIVNTNRLVSREQNVYLTTGERLINGYDNPYNLMANIYAKGDVVMEVVNDGNNLVEGQFYGVLNNDNITAGHSVYFAAQNEGQTKPVAYGEVINKGGIRAGYTMDLDEKGNILNSDNLVPQTETEGYVEFYANGNITNHGEILAYKSVNMITTKQLINTADIKSEAGDVALLSVENLGNDGKVEAYGNVGLFSSMEGVINKADIISKEGKVNIEAAYIFSKELEYLRDDIKIDPKTTEGNIKNDGTITAKQEVSLISHAGMIANQGDILSQESEVKIISDIDKSVLDTMETGGPALGEFGTVINSGDIVAKTGIRMEAFTSLGNLANMKLKGDGDIIVLSGVNVETDTSGGIKIEGKDKAHGHLFNGGSFEIEGQGSIKLVAKTDVRNAGVMEAQYGDIIIATAEGNIYNYETADLYAGGGNVQLTALAEKAETFYYDDNKEKVAIDRGDAANFRELVNGAERVIQYYGQDNQWHDVIATGVIYNSGDAMALGQDGEGGIISFTSRHGSVYNYDDFSTLRNKDGKLYSSYKRGVGGVTEGGMLVGTDNIVLSAEEGFLYNEKNILSHENVMLTAKYGLSNFAYNITANGNIDLVATDGNLYNNAELISETGDITLKANNGTVVNLLNGDLLALGGNVSLISGASKVDEKGQLKPNANTIYTVDSGYVYEDAEGKHHSASTGNTNTLMNLLPAGTEIAWPQGVEDSIVTVDKYYLVGGTGDAKLIDQTVVVNSLSKAEQESIYAMVNVVDASGSPVRLKDTNGNELKVMGNIDVYRLGDTLNRGDIVAMGSTTFNVDGEVESIKPGTVHLRSEHGNVANYDNFALVDGAASMEEKYLYARDGKKYVLGAAGIGMEAPEGYFYNSLGYETDGDLIIEAKKDMTIGDNLTVGHVGGDIIITSTEGKVSNVGDSVLTAGNNVILTGKTGVENDGVVTGEKGKVEFNAEEGDVVNKGKVNAGTEANLKSEKGSVISEGSITSGTDTNITAGKDVIVSGELNSGKDIIITAAEDALLSGNLEAEGKVAVSAGNEVLSVGDVIKAAETVKISGTKGVTVDNAIEAGDKVTVNSEEGSVNLKGVVDSGSDVEVTAKEDVKVEADVNAKGDVAVEAGKDATVSGDITSDKDVTVNAGEDVTINGDIDSKGQIELKADNDVTSNGVVNSGDSVGISAGNNATISGDITSGADTSIAAGKDIAVSGDVDAKDSVSLEAKENITTEGTLTAGEAVTLKADGTVTTTGDIKAGSAVAISGAQGVAVDNTITASDMVTVDSAEGSVNLKGVVDSGSDVEITAKENTKAEADIDAVGDVIISADNDVTVSGDIETEGKVDLKAGNDATVNGDVTSDQDVTVTAGHDVTVSGDIDAEGKVDLRADNNVTASGAINSGDATNINAGKDVTVSGDVYAEGKAELKAENDVAVSGDINSGKEVTVIAGKDATVSGDIISNADTTITAGKDLAVSGNIEAEGNVTLEAKENITSESNLTAGEDVTLKAHGNVTTTGDIKAGAEVAISGIKGVDVDNTITASDKVTVDSAEDSVNLKGLVDSGSDVEVTAKEDAKVEAEVKAKGDATISAGNDANASGNITSGADTTIIAAKATAVSGDINSGNKVTVQAQTVTMDGSVNAQSKVLLQATKGNLSLNKQVQNKAEGIEIYAKDGAIDINDNVTAGGTGLLRIYAELEEQKLSQELVDAVIAKGELKSINGSVDISALNGQISLNKVEAKETAAVGTDKGDIVLGTISAGTVVLYNKSAENSVAADKVIVDKHLVIQSAAPEIEKIEAAPGAQQITLDITGTEGKVGGKVNIGSLDDKVDYSIGNLAVGSAKVKSGSNIHIGKLYLNGEENSEVIAKGQIAIDSLAVANKLAVSGYGYDTSVYGSAPRYDGSQALYYDNGMDSLQPGKLALDFDLGQLYFGTEDKQPAIDKLAQALSQTKPTPNRGEGEGMHLYIDSAYNQTSNGELLHVTNYHYVHNQRYSAENLSRMLNSYVALKDYASIYEDAMGLFHRYDLYELPGVEIVNGQLENTLAELTIVDQDEK